MNRFVDNQIFKNFLECSEQEQAMVLKTISENVWSFNDELRGIDFNIESYYERRIADRDPAITWPKNLSKKERVLCKITLLTKLLRNCSSSNTDNDYIYHWCSNFVYSIKNNIFKPKDSTWKGLSKIEALILNSIYESLTRCYRQQIVF